MNLSFGVIFIIVVIIVGKLNFNEKIKKIIMSIFSIIFNFGVGFLSFNILFSIVIIVCSVSGNEIIGTILLGLPIYIALLGPMNIFIKKHGKINSIFYILINVLAIILGFIIFIILLRAGI